MAEDTVQPDDKIKQETLTTADLPPADDPNKIQVDIEKLKKTKVHICMPCYGGQLTESTFMSMIRWSNTARQLGIDWTVETLTNESLISRARNTLVAKFLSNPDSTHLMFIDADIGWEPWHLLLLLHHDKDVIGGMYPLKALPIKWCVNGIEGGKEEDMGRLQEVSKTGTGFMCIKRHVFKKLDDHPATIPFINDIGLDPKLNKDMKTFFDTDVREGRYYSEDWTFCENWRDLGGEVWVDKRVLLKHTGTFTYDHVGQDAVYKALHEELKDKAPLVINADEGKIDMPAQQAALPPERRSAKILAKTGGKKKKAS
jgi:hypothetical protein